jgi:prephenate dehydrogenase
VSRVGVVGYGRFGRALGDRIRGRGHALSVFDPFVASTAPEAPDVDLVPSIERLGGCDVVLVATPIAAMPEVFGRLEEAFAAAGALASRDGTRAVSPLVMDVGSVKLGPVRALEASLGDRAVGCHPLFGPTSLARAERPLAVVVCPSASEPRTREAEAFWRDLGCETLRVEAAEHDRVMARTHALAFFVAKGIIDAGLDDPPPFSPPSYRAMARSLEAVRADAGHLFRSVEVDNPFAAGVRADFLRALGAADAELTTSNAEGEAPASPSSFRSPSTNAEPTAAGALDSERALFEARSLIDELDREIVDRLARRAELAERAAVAKLALGVGTRDPAREAELLERRRAWARAAGLDEDAVGGIFEAVLRFSRAHQRGGDRDA